MAAVVLLGAGAGAIVLRAGGSGDSVAGSDGDVGIVRLESARTSDDGTSLVVAFVGSDPELPDGDPCSSSYTGVARVEGTSLVVGVSASEPDGDGDELDCTAEAHLRNVTIDLPEPAAGRDVRDLATSQVIDVFDGSGTCVPQEVPDGYGLVAETEAPGPLRAWNATFAPTGRAGGRPPRELVVQSGDETLRDAYRGWPVQSDVVSAALTSRSGGTSTTMPATSRYSARRREPS